MKRFFFLLLLAPLSALATIYNIANSEAAYNAITQADGDVINIAAGPATWTGPHTINKAVTIAGAGAGVVIARSGTSVTYGTGTQVFTVASSLAISNGDTLTCYRTGGTPNGGFPSVQAYMQGTVTSYSGTTLTMNMTVNTGSGTDHLWYFVTEPAALTSITANTGSSVLFIINESVVGQVFFSGIRLINGTGTNDLVNFVFTSGGKPISFHDCLFFSSVSTSDCIQSSTNRGVIWNTYFCATPYSAAQLAIHLIDAPSSSWSTTSTIGALDTTGTGNLYLENCVYEAWLNSTDYDNNARAVMRNSYFDNAAIGTHGPDTSNYGNRHFECYDSTVHWDGFSDGKTLPYSRLFYLRGGVAIITDCTIDTASGSDYGGKPAIDMTAMNLQRNAGPNPFWGSVSGGGSPTPGQYYPLPRQVGSGYVTGVRVATYAQTTPTVYSVAGVTDSITYIGDLEPCYFWNNTGVNTINAVTSDFGGTSAGVVTDVSSNYIVAGRDYYNNGTARPGYVKYTYPNPWRTGATVAGGSVISGKMVLSGNLKVQ